jgi:hypothetical protein
MPRWLPGVPTKLPLMGTAWLMSRVTATRKKKGFRHSDSDRIAAMRQWPVPELVNSRRALDDDPTLIDRISL